MYAKTTNGNIKLEIAGSKADYKIIYQTRNGSARIDDVGMDKSGTINPINQGSSKRIEMITGNGSAELSFG